MSTALHFELVSPERLLASREVYMVVVPGIEGDFGVLAGHAPVMSVVREGTLQIFADPQSPPESLLIQGGFAEVSDKGLTLLID